MKTLLVTASIALVGISTAHAQIYRPSVGSGAVVGAVAGGLIGGHNGDRWAEGAIIGSVAGALIGAAMSPQEQVYTPPPVYQTQAPVVYGQQVYGQPTVANAPVVVDQTQAPVQYQQPAPQVVYAPAPQVVAGRQNLEERADLLMLARCCHRWPRAPGRPAFLSKNSRHRA